MLGFFKIRLYHFSQHKKIRHSDDTSVCFLFVFILLCALCRVSHYYIFEFGPLGSPIGRGLYIFVSIFFIITKLYYLS